MRRRSLLGGGAAVAAVGATGLAAPAIAAGGHTLLMVTSWGRGLPILARSVERLAESIATLTDGRLRFEVAHSGERVGAFEVFDAVSRGEADVYHSAEYYWQDRHPAYAFFTAVPFGFTSSEMMGWMRFNGGETLWRELAARYNLRPFIAGTTGCQMGGWFPDRIESIEQMQGKTFRIPGIGGKVWAAAGVTVVNLPGTELIPALFDGRVDAVEWIGPHIDMEVGFGKILPAYMYPGWQEPGTMFSVAFNAGVFDSLSEADRTLIDIACVQETNLVRAEFLKANGEAMNLMRREFGVGAQRFPDALLAEFFRLSQAVMADIVGFDAFSRRVAESFDAFRLQQARFSTITTHEYIAARNRFLGLDGIYRYD